MSFLELRRATILLLLGIVCLSPVWTTAQQRPGPSHRRASDFSSQKAAEAAEALFEHSDLAAARIAAQQVIRLPKRRWTTPSLASAPQSLIQALFVEMEAAALQADTHAELDAALRLCELAGASDDPRASIAASRILDLAGNTSEFRAAIPRVKSVLNTPGTQRASDLRAALLAAAADGAPGLSELELARDSGLITDWKIVGPLGEFSNVAFERTWQPERDGVGSDDYGDRYVESFQFPSGEVSLPEYLNGDGVYYAAARVKLASTGKWTVRIESPGTIQAWVDGTLMLTKDDRFRATAETVGADTDLRAGTHHVLIKFIPSAVPFRVAIVPSIVRRAPQLRASAPESGYVSAAQAYWGGDYGAASERLLQLRKGHDSALVDFLLAQVLSHSSKNSSDRTELLDSTLRLAPDAHAARYEHASIHFAKGEIKDAFETAKALLASQPRFEPAEHLAAEAASRLGLKSEAKRAFAAAVDLHWSCAVLKDASAFYESISDVEQASTYDNKLRNCAPNSLAWPEALARTGRHAEAAAALKRFVAASPLNRSARELLVRELALAGRLNEAQEAVDQLAELAPNSVEYRRMAATLHSGGEAFDSINAGNSLADGDDFYSNYRRDGVELVQQTADRKFSGGPLVVLLNERVAEVKANGAASIYVHRISRVLDRDGINKYGEVTLPNEASLLELRTIKPDGSIIEPEFNQHKSTISMPALSPGDAIELEYVIRDVDGGVFSHPELFQFTFGSFSAPTVFSRFVALTPRESNVKYELSGKLPLVRVEANRNATVRIWELNDIPQSTSENSMPASGVLPSITLLWSESSGWAGVRDFYRDAFIDAVHHSDRIQKVAQRFTGTDEQRLRAAYEFVVLRIRKSDTEYDLGDLTTADMTLANYSGSRAAALLAVAKEMGVTGKVLMARDVGLRAPEIPTPHAYTHPLLVFHLPETGDIALDPETNGMIFGGVASGLETRDALVVPIYEAEDAPLIAAVPKPLADERSSAEGSVTFDENGDLAAHIKIQMGAARGAQMRNMLRGIGPSGRKRFFEQLASRIFPSVASADGSVQNETNTDSPLVLLVDCQASRFVDFSKPRTELDQLVPALGLRKMYRTDGNRNTPLLVETPLVEDSWFRITLPSGAFFLPLLNDVNERSEFGDYSVTFKRISPTTVEVRRVFDIPVQIISQDRFGSFARFARNVDDAERQHLIVQRSSTQTASHGGQN